MERRLRINSKIKNHDFLKKKTLRLNLFFMFVKVFEPQLQIN